MKHFILFTLLLPSIVYAQNGPIDTSLYVIYKDIFVTKCAIPACHDGSFEPDLRTLSSAYSTLVYHPIIKNNRANSFKYRVVPYDTSASVLHERLTNCCFVNDHDQMPFTIGVTLSSGEIKKINDWISSGAKDLQGQDHHLVNLPPFISDEYYAFYDDTIPVITPRDRIDNFMYRPFIISEKTKRIRIDFSVSDDISSAKDLKGIHVKIFSSPSDSVILPLTYTHTAWEANFDTKTFEKGKSYYMQLYAADPLTGLVSYYPNENTRNYMRGNWSFILK